MLSPNRRRIGLMGIVIVVAGPGCQRTDFCAGAPTCFGAEVVQCQNVPGCTGTPGCVEDPLRGIDCTTPATEAACLKVQDCSWSGTQCREACGAIPDQPTCAANPFCRWSACSGRARPCREYSVDMCPISPIGCYVDPGN